MEHVTLELIGLTLLSEEEMQGIAGGFSHWWYVCILPFAFLGAKKVLSGCLESSIADVESKSNIYWSLMCQDNYLLIKNIEKNNKPVLLKEDICKLIERKEEKIYRPAIKNYLDDLPLEKVDDVVKDLGINKGFYIPMDTTREEIYVKFKSMVFDDNAKNGLSNMTKEVFSEAEAIIMHEVNTELGLNKIKENQFYEHKSHSQVFLNFLKQIEKDYSRSYIYKAFQFQFNKGCGPCTLNDLKTLRKSFEDGLNYRAHYSLYNLDDMYEKKEMYNTLTKGMTHDQQVEAVDLADKSIKLITSLYQESKINLETKQKVDDIEKQLPEKTWLSLLKSNRKKDASLQTTRTDWEFFQDCYKGAYKYHKKQSLANMLWRARVGNDVLNALFEHIESDLSSEMKRSFIKISGTHIIVVGASIGAICSGALIGVVNVICNMLSSKSTRSDSMENYKSCIRQS